MQIEVLLVRRESRTGKSIQVILAEKPYRALWIPRFALREEYQIGERDLILEIKQCSWAYEYEQTEWRELMQRERESCKKN